MRISKKHTVVRLLSVLLVLGVLAFLGVSCDTSSPGEEDGTVTVTLPNAAAHDGELALFAIFKEGVDPYGGSAVADGAVFVLIASGVAQGTMKDLATMINDVIYPGGGKYFVSTLVDVDGSLDLSGGDLFYIGSVFTIDGNRTETLDLVSFSLKGFTLSGSLTKSGITDGRFAYTKLVAQGGAATDAALYWAKSTAFNSGTATYSITDITQATYTQYIFIDVNNNATGDGTSLPDSGDYGGAVPVDVIMNSDQTSDWPNGSWVLM